MTPRQFRSRRRDLGHSQRSLALALGYSKNHVCALENGSKSIRKLVELALDGLEARAARTAEPDGEAHP